jgi:pimeloyl-ACP methyl ester carboxylesterase
MAMARAPEVRPGPHERGLAGCAQADRGPAEAPALASESSRARYPDATGVVKRAGGRVAWEAYGSGDPPIVFVPPWQIVHSRVWKAQIPDFARRHRVLAWDARGNGHSDRPTDPLAHTTRARAEDLGAVMDAARVHQAVLVGLSSASVPMLIFAGHHPERVLGMVFVCPATPFGLPGPGADGPFEEPLADDEGWNKENLHFWRRDFAAYLEFFFAEALPETHSTKQREDGVAYGLDTDPESLAATVRAPSSVDLPTLTAMCATIRCPVVVIQGTDERITDVTQGIGLAEAIPGATLVLVEGAGHIPNARDPVKVNLAIRDFVNGLGGTGRPGMSR